MLQDMPTSLRPALSRTFCALWVASALLTAGCSPSAPPSPTLQAISQLPPANDASCVESEISKPVVMVHFLASWCSLCAFELPNIIALKRNSTAENVGIVAIALEDTPEDAAAFAQKFRLPMPLVVDTTGTTRRLFGVSDLPTTVLITPDGGPVLLPDPKTGERTNRFVGAYEWDRGELLRSLVAIE